MVNILLISSIYPFPDMSNKGTYVCHYFAREWVKMGYNVRVVHFQAVYPAPFYWLARIARNRIAAKTGAVVYTRKDKGGLFELDGVKIYRIPLFKPIPHGKFLHSVVVKSQQSIIKWLSEDGFAPDVIVGHFPNPQIEVISSLKKVWPKAISAVVMHLEAENKSIKFIYGERFNEMKKGIDIWGFRNRMLYQLFEKEIMPVPHSFICYSGIPENYIVKSNKHSFNKRSLENFIFVGEMINRKNPIQVLDALQIVYKEKDYHLTYVGEGNLLNDIKNRLERDGLSSCVSVMGKVLRDEIKTLYDAADCMIMISSGEAYGLVYLEAMARGCITIASRNEGFDGVIVDGENGFLCEAGNTKELADIIKKINAMSPMERQRISDSAIDTAKTLTDAKAAERYINDVINRTQ